MLVVAASAAQADFASRIAVNGTLTYTETSNNGLSIGDSNSALNAAGTFPLTRSAEFIDPDMELDYGLGFTYRMGDNSDTRLFFDWDRYGSGRSAALANAYGIGSPAAVANVSSGTGHVDTDYDQFRFGVNHALHFGDKLDITLTGFFDYTNIERDLHTFNYDATAGTNHYLAIHDEMSGWGPGFGATARVTPFDVCPQVGLFGGLSTTLLYVDNEYRANYREADDAIFNLHPEDSNSMVAKFDAEFGVDYQKLFQTSWAPIKFQAALGLRYNNVVNAFKGGNTGDMGLDSPFARGFASDSINANNVNDFGRFGPFLRFSIGGANS